LCSLQTFHLNKTEDEWIPRRGRRQGIITPTQSKFGLKTQEFLRHTSSPPIPNPPRKRGRPFKRPQIIVDIIQQQSPETIGEIQSVSLGSSNAGEKRLSNYKPCPKKFKKDMEEIKVVDSSTKPCPKKFKKDMEIKVVDSSTVQTPPPPPISTKPCPKKFKNNSSEKTDGASTSASSKTLVDISSTVTIEIDKRHKGGIQFVEGLLSSPGGRPMRKSAVTARSLIQRVANAEAEETDNIISQHTRPSPHSLSQLELRSQEEFLLPPSDTEEDSQMYVHSIKLIN
jgi:hypothetical protein